MGNAFGTKKKDYLYEGDFYYGSSDPNLHSEDAPPPTDFDKLPAFRPNYYEKQKKKLKQISKAHAQERESPNVRTIPTLPGRSLTGHVQLAQLIVLMNEVLSDKKKGKKEGLSQAGAIWGAGIGFGGGDASNYDAKMERDERMGEDREREAVLIHAFHLFTQCLDSSDAAQVKEVSELFPESPVCQDLRGILSNDSMLDITKHDLFYWHSWQFLMAMAGHPTLRSCIFGGGFYREMRHLITVAETYNQRMEKMPSYAKAHNSSGRLIDEIINSRSRLRAAKKSYSQDSPKIAAPDDNENRPRRPRKKRRRTKTKAKTPTDREAENKDQKPDSPVIEESKQKESPKEVAEVKEEKEEVKEEKMEDGLALPPEMMIGEEGNPDEAVWMTPPPPSTTPECSNSETSHGEKKVEGEQTAKQEEITALMTEAIAKPPPLPVEDSDTDADEVDDDDDELVDTSQPTGASIETLLAQLGPSPAPPAPLSAEPSLDPPVVSTLTIEPPEDSAPAERGVETKNEEPVEETPTTPEAAPAEEKKPKTKNGKKKAKRKGSRREPKAPAKRKTSRPKRKKKEEPSDPYVREMMPLVFDSCKFTSKEYRSGAEMSASALNRLVLEIQSLADALPTCLTPDSSIYLRTNDQNIDLMKAMIIGPAGTPYSLGCFEFDLKIPSNYPMAPPQCKIVTTGNGTFRFNPNLYANGKVCLSLIGTWPGAPEELWDPKVSTLLQVFISIQSLIMVPDPYYNEPGYQFSRNTGANDAYNVDIQRGTVRFALIAQLKDKKNTFRDVIHAHCRQKREAILQQCAEWNIDEALIGQLREELDAL